MDTTNNNIITSESLKQTQRINLPPVVTDTTSTSGVVDSVASSIASQFDTLTAQRDQQQKNVEGSQTDITSLMESLTGKTADTQAAERAAGVDTATANQNTALTQLANLNAQAQSLNREAQAIPIQTQQNFANTGATDRGVAPITAGKLRENALRALSIGQQSDIAMANLTGSQVALQSANDKAQKIIDLKYEPMEAALKIKQQQYLFIKDNLTTAELKRGEALQIRLTKEAAALAEKKQVEKDIQGIALEIAKNGGDPNIIKGATSVADAINKAGSSLATPMTDIVKLDNGKTILVDKRTGKVIHNFGGAAQSSGGSFAITSNALKTTYNNDAVALISNVIKSSKAKPNQAMTDAINVISGIQVMVKDNPNFNFPGTNPLIRMPGIFASERALTNRNNVAGINLKVQQWASGASLTEQQTKAVKKMTPDKNDTDRQVRNKLNTLANYMSSQVSGQLAGQGVSFVSEKIDYFAPSSEEKLKTLYIADSQTALKIEQVIQQYPDASADEILQIIE